MDPLKATIFGLREHDPKESRGPCCARVGQSGEVGEHLSFTTMNIWGWGGLFGR
jgi:hypothetical protein